ncbi:rRNA biogenesis protein RRP36 [Sphaerosporella brunnea]|uniref:rRNA biogenesis protein RRP36 n=1 Tax=Sphaerosporella brunnea TaxID=1250544 RepID=A0A5J5F3I3_9PEZI|nr:rRNA biogenesis protein RRP36 [Sphaerosporella brunnea]
MQVRRVKPQLRDDSDVEEYPGTDFGAAQSDEDERMSNAASDERSADDTEQEEEEEAAAEKPSAHTTISKISFATLARAQALLPKDKQKSNTSTSLTITKSQQQQRGTPKNILARPPSEKKAPPPSRASKNAPQEISSKRAVTRKREVVEAPPIPKARDPRFDPAVNGRYDERQFRKNFAFLDDYRNDEMRLLKEELRKTKDERKTEQLSKKLISMESRKQTQQNKDRVEEVRREYIRKERELVKQGKTPYHPKKSEIKKMVLEKQFSKMSEKQAERVIARKQKRKAQKERKKMPWERREVS